MKKLKKIEEKRIVELRKQFPKKIDVTIRRLENDGFFAEITTFPGCTTESNTFSELIEMVNDCVRTYFEIPQKYVSFMPTYLPPLQVAKDFDVFPNIGSNLQETNFSIQNGNEKVKA
jgi:predicted RNase H-like HicB family nuclease